MSKTDAWGRPVDDSGSPVPGADPHAAAVMGTGALPVDSPNQVSEKPDQAVARLTADAIEKRDKIVALGGKLDGLPDISGMTPADLQRVVDTYEQRRAEAADKAAMVFQKNTMEALGVAGLAGAGAMLGGADKMLPAGNGVYSPEELARRSGQQPENLAGAHTAEDLLLAQSGKGGAKLPINKELEEMLAKGGFKKEALVLAGVRGDGADIGGEKSALLSNDPNLPKTQEAIERTAKENDRAMQLRNSATA